MKIKMHSKVFVYSAFLIAESRAKFIKIPFTKKKTQIAMFFHIILVRFYLPKEFREIFAEFIFAVLNHTICKSFFRKTDQSQN